MKNEFMVWESNKEVINKHITPYNITDIDRFAIGLVYPKTMVLSAGCGGGREVSYLKKIGCDIVGIDISENMINLSKKINPDVKHIVGNCVDYIKKDSFDYVICLWNTINHMDFADRRNFINNSYKNLKKGGYLIIKTQTLFTNWKVALKYNKFTFGKYNFYYLPLQIKKWFLNTSFKWEIIKLKDKEATHLVIVAKKQ